MQKVLAFGTKRFRTIVIFGACIVSLAILSVFIFLLYVYTKEVESRSKDILSTSVEKTVGIMRLWVREQKDFLEQIAAAPFVTSNVTKLVSGDLTQEETVLVRKEMKEYLRTFYKDIIDYEMTVVDTEGNVIVSSSSEKGHSKVSVFLKPNAASYVDAVLEGNTVFVPPLPSGDQNEIANVTKINPVVSFLTPISNESGEIIALLKRHSHSDSKFSDQLSVGEGEETSRDMRYLDSIDTYAYDRYGYIISNVRFKKTLERAISESIGHSEEHRIGQMDFLSKKQTDILTMRIGISSPLSNGSAIQSYPDYGGVEVFGVWRWVPDLGIGIISEIDKATVYHSVKEYAYLFVFASLFSIGAIVVGTYLILSYSAKYAKQVANINFDLEHEIEVRTSTLEYSQNKLATALKEAQHASKNQEAFVANISHEIRTPMNSIIGFSEVLADSQLDSAQRDYVQIIGDSATSLLTLINDILDISKIRDGKFKLDEREFELHRLIQRSVQSFKLEAERKNIDLIWKIDSDVPNRVQGDQGRLRQVITNLLGNALKFTEQGFVSIKVYRSKGDRVGFIVKDSGCGMPKEQLDNIFKPFYQLENNDKTHGTGLGTTIAQQIIDLMDGWITVNSTVGEGSTFQFEVYLPNLDVAKFDHTVSGWEIEEHNLREINFLLAEDVEVNIQLMQVWLDRMGHKLTVTKNGAEVVEKYKQNPLAFDCILMDIHMPILDGLQATQMIREYEKEEDSIERTVPIIALTASAGDEETDRYFEVGMNDFCLKPININKLMGIVADVVPDSVKISNLEEDEIKVS